MARRTAFVTGATGFLGQNICEQLVADGGWRVVGLCRAGSDTGLLSSFGVELAEGDIVDLRSLRQAMPDDVEAVFHTAAMTSMWREQADEQEQVNVEGTRNVVDTLLERGGGRLIHTSTWNVFDRTSGPMTEETAKSGKSSWISYDRTKLLAEEVVLSAVEQVGLDAVITNPSHILGRYDRQNWARMIMMAVLGKLPGVPSGAGDFAHGEQVARAHLAAVDKGRTGENYILAGPHASFLEVVRKAASLAHQPKVPKRPLPDAIMRLMGRVDPWIARLSGRIPDITPEAVALVTADMHSTSTKAQDELGYEPSPLDTSIEDCYRWLMKSGMIRSR